MSIGTVPEDATPVGSEVMQSADTPVTELHKGVSNELIRIGHPATPDSINPDHSKILGDVVRVAGGITDESVGGVDHFTHSGVTRNNLLNGIKRIREALKRRFPKKAP